MIPNVVTSVMFERLAAHTGPTGGKILRPSGQRGEERVCPRRLERREPLKYCSGICCLASLKQATYIREQAPESKSFYLLY
jgi:heterodisulfide reductase subunit A-like polyferredoxin